MTTEKFISEVNTLKKFFELHCKNKHHSSKKSNTKLSYNDTHITLQLDLCDECFELLEYSLQRLHNCPYEQKPRCRSCANPCYEKNKWKKIAKIMRYSAIHLKLSKLTKVLKEKIF